MRPIATDIDARSVVCLSDSASVLGTRVTCAKTVEPIEMRLFGGRLGGRAPKETCY